MPVFVNGRGEQRAAWRLIEDGSSTKIHVATPWVPDAWARVRRFKRAVQREIGAQGKHAAAIRRVCFIVVRASRCKDPSSAGIYRHAAIPPDATSTIRYCNARDDLENIGYHR